jgi:hypothetical protein
VLPGINGHVVYRKIKEKFGKIKIALFSGEAQTQTKPFDPHELIERVNNLFKNIDL